jgi:hypothetical protein
LLQQAARDLIHPRDFKIGHEHIPNRIIELREKIPMAGELVVDEFKLADIDRRVFWSVLSQKNDWLVRGGCDSQFEEYVCIGSGDIGDQEYAAEICPEILVINSLVRTLLSPRSTRILYFSSRYLFK